ncbi:MAG: site-specific DNA-methyltransferase, partial [Actinomycetota bacterium]|nr:site-specific DNA-methyltransferase [Actinomycetota bacterium]
MIELYTYRGDLVLDPFAGSGTTAVAAVRACRHFVGYDLDESYVSLAETRVADERQRLVREASTTPLRVCLPAVPAPAGPDEDFQSRAVREGRAAKEIAGSIIEAAVSLTFRRISVSREVSKRISRLGIGEGSFVSLMS